MPDPLSELEQLAEAARDTIAGLLNEAAGWARRIDEADRALTTCKLTRREQNKHHSRKAQAVYELATLRRRLHRLTVALEGGDLRALEAEDEASARFLDLFYPLDKAA
jgi:hypothetical protein